MFSEWWIGLRLKILALLQRRQLEQDLQDEIKFHLEMHQDELDRPEMKAEQKGAEARRRFGSVTHAEEEVRDMWTFPAWEALLQDARYACRSLRRAPGFVAVVVLSLAFGIAANSTIFSVVNAAVFRPLPFEEPDSLMVIWQQERGKPESKQGPPIAEGVDWNQQNRSFEEIAQTSGREEVPLSRLGNPEMIPVQYVTPNYFEALRVHPKAGRIFTAQEAKDEAQTVVVSDGFARQHFGNAGSALGRTFALSGVESTVVGVVADSLTDLHGRRVAVWQPINPASGRYSSRKDSGWLMPLGRLRNGVSQAQAQGDMAVIARRMEKAYPDADKGMEARVVPLQEALSVWARTLYPFFGAVGFVLLIACLNVANLMQSRGETRRREEALRASLGASRRRIIQHVLIESSLLAWCGGLLGLVLTLTGMKVFVSAAAWFPNAAAIRIDLRVVIFTLFISTGSALVFGLLPAWQAANPNLSKTLREGDRRTVAGSRKRTRQWFVIGEIAVAVVLLVGAGLMIKTIFRMTAMDHGFDPANLVVASIYLPEGGKYVDLSGAHDMQRTKPAVDDFYQQLLIKLAVIPGVESVATSGNPSSVTLSFLDRPAAQNRPRATCREVSSGFFRSLKIPLKRGRYLGEVDGPGTAWAAVVNETFAERYFPKENPIGKLILIRTEPYQVNESRPRQIVGVVGNIREHGSGESVPPAVFSSFRQQSNLYPGGAVLAHTAQEVFIRTVPRLNLEQLAAEVRKVSATIDPDQPVTDIETVNDAMRDSIADTQLVARLLQVFAGMALLLAMLGIYGVISYFVNERAQEIGIRMALGATRTNVMGLVTGFGLKLTLIGLFLGAALALTLTHLISRFLYGVSATDPTTFLSVGGVLLAVAMLASFLPGRRAARLDPIVTLRQN